jgi:hypothetical protein
VKPSSPFNLRLTARALAAAGLGAELQRALESATEAEVAQRSGPARAPPQTPRRYFPMQKFAKIRPSSSSLVTSPVISPSCFCASVSS